MWPHAERMTIAHTGHLGLITRPGEFANAVAGFADRQVGRTLSGPPGARGNARPTLEATEKKVG